MIAPSAGRLLAVFAFLVSGVAAGCGDTVLTSPSPEVVETAESLAREATFMAPVSATPDPEREDEDPITLDARIFGSGPVGVILAHMRTADQTSWFPFATELAETGDYTVLTFDFRGYGESTGDKEFDRLDLDLDAAVEFMAADLDHDEIYIVGASMGGTAALVTAARKPAIDGVFAVSALSDFRYLEPLDVIPLVEVPIAFVVAEDDVAAARSLEELYTAATQPKSQHVYEGDEHGMALFDGPHGDDLRARIYHFLENPSEPVGTAPTVAGG